MKQFSFLFLFGLLLLIYFGLFSCGSTKSALRTYDDLKWAKNNYHSNTLHLFEEVFFLENRDLRNAGVYYLTELYFDLKVTPLLEAGKKSAKKLSPKRLQKRNEKKLAKAKIVTLLKKRFYLEKDFNVKNVILRFIATLGEEAYWLEDTNFRTDELSKNAIFIASAIEDNDPSIARYAISLLANEEYLIKYKVISVDSQQMVVSIIENYYQSEIKNLSPVFVARVFKIIHYFDSNSDLLKTIDREFNFLVKTDE